MSGCNKSYVHLPIPDVSQASEPFLFQNFQQLRLNLKVHIADFVEKDRAAMGHLKKTLLGGSRTREGAFFVTEEFCLEQFSGETSTIEIDESFVGSRAVLM